MGNSGGFGAVLEKIDAADHIAVIAHINPDADSLGSASAMYSLLLRLHKKVTFFCATENIDLRLAFLPWFDKLRHRFPTSADLAISLDCGSKKRLGAEIKCPLVNIDHHVGNEAYGEINIIDSTAISTTQVLYELFEDHGIKLNTKMATSLYAGLLDDSLGFLSEKTDARAFAMAAVLSKAGADTRGCAIELFERRSLAAMRLKGMMLQKMSLVQNGDIVLLKVTREMLLQSGAHAADCEAVLHESMGLPTVKVAVLLRERRDGSIKGSLRSFDGSDMAAVADCFGGGGHSTSAGFELPFINMADAEAVVLQKLKKELS
jgi:phosphoesterase RecJ-like protein